MKATRRLTLVLAMLIHTPLLLGLTQTGLTIDAVIVADANLRVGPGTTYEIIGYARTGQLVTVTDYEAEWYQLSTGEWIASFLVKPTADSRVVAFRLTDIPATARRLANLRVGPGLHYTIVGRAVAGQRLEVVAQNQAGDWLKLSNDQWIAAFLVGRPAIGLPVINTDSSTLATATPETQPISPLTPLPAVH